MASLVCHLDESIPEDGSLVAIAGFIADATVLQQLAERWRSLKVDTFGIAADAELKYTMGETHPARKDLDENGWTQARRVPVMLEMVRDFGLTIVADAVYPVKDGLSPRALYLDGLGWCIRRHMNHVGREDGPHWVVIDYPPDPGDLTDTSERIRELYSYVRTAAFDQYARLYWEPEVIEGHDPAPPLRERGFAPSLLAAVATPKPLPVNDGMW